MKTDNELIAIFLGWTPCECDTPKKLHYKFGEKIWDVVEYDKMKFDTDWNWLMPAVSKIGELYEKAFPSNEEFIKRILEHNDPIDKEYVDVISTSINTPINEVHEVVVKFIKWYSSRGGGN